MKYKIKTSQFCNLVKQRRFQHWLQSMAPDLYMDLMGHVKTSRSCSSNRKKMVEVRKQLGTRGLNKPLVAFLKNNFPLTLTKIVEGQDESTIDVQTKAAFIMTKQMKEDGVFGDYAPKVLTFPQKLILTNEDPVILERDVRKFLMNKLSHDYIVIGNRAYVEYFNNQYEPETKSVKRGTRDIFLYRNKTGLRAGTKRLKNIAEQGE